MTNAAITPGEIGALMIGSAALITAGWTILAFFIKNQFKILGVTVSATVLRYVKKHLESEIEGRDPESYYTLDVHFTNGITLVAPMIPNKELTIAENLGISVINHSCESTVLSLTSHGDCYLPPHWHATTSEMIEVRSGTITHIETGRVYRTDEIWHIPAGEPHSAVFSRDCFAIVTHRPALPTAKERPVDLEHIEDAFRMSPKNKP